MLSRLLQAAWVAADRGSGDFPLLVSSQTRGAGVRSG